jgi:2-hydroxy-3-keto-5-methylthiopentenyl-1-phosphate phosphatase
VANLTSTTVLLDYDGTVTTVDTGVHLLERVGEPGWMAVDDEYAAGAIGSRECISRQWAMLPKDEALLREVAREVPLDPGFDDLLDGLRAAGADLLVVSDGFGFHVEEAMAARGVPVLTNAVDWTTGDITFPNEDRCCPCTTCGTCKQAPIKDAKRAGRRTVFVGDGTSDRKAALIADVVFAKGALADWCDDAGVDHHRFDTLADVHRMLLGQDPPVG